ncbi:Signaling mucin HKR1-like 3 [Homarus americanus]|uniref:Signaling mucin HKR1-like 3 n=1 Tax=Homarus americanus TaxID=6706 RepID=A0A8J5N572_HOMAM|nr:Signaling mucin HKR1-like 3 [Homarus americanus]
MKVLLLVMLVMVMSGVPGCEAGTKWIPVGPGAPRRRTTGVGGCAHPGGFMELGQRAYLPSCDPLPERLPYPCEIRHFPLKRHPDCCPRVVCFPGAPTLSRGPLRPQVSPERRYQRVPSRTETQVIADLQYKSGFKNRTYDRVVGYPGTRWRSTPEAVTSPSPYMTTEIIYGKSYSKPQSSTESTNLHDVYNNHHYRDPTSWEDQAAIVLEPPNNKIRENTSTQDEDTRIEMEEEIKLRQDTPEYFVTPDLQDHRATRNSTQQTEVSYWHFTKANNVKTSPLPYRELSTSLPITELFSTTPSPEGEPEKKITTNSFSSGAAFSYTPWRPVAKRTTLYPFTMTKTPTFTTPISSLTTTTDNYAFPSSSTVFSRYYPTNGLVPSTTPVYPSIRINQKTYVRTKPTDRVSLTTPAYEIYKRVTRRPTQRSRLTKRPGVNKIPTPRPGVEFTRTTPASYEFATPKLNPSKHNIHEFILSPLDPSQLIPGHDEYLQAKQQVMKEYTSSPDEKSHSKKRRRSLPYTEATLSYKKPDKSTSPTEAPETDGVRQKRGRPVFYIPWRENLVPLSTPPVSDAQDYDDEIDGSGKSFEKINFDKSDIFVTETPLINHITSEAFTSISFGSANTEAPYSSGNSLSVSGIEDHIYSSHITEGKLGIRDVIDQTLNQENNDELLAWEDKETTTEESVLVTPATTYATISPTTHYPTTIPTHLQHIFTTHVPGLDSTDDREMDDSQERINSWGADVEDDVVSGGEGVKVPLLHDGDPGPSTHIFTTSAPSALDAQEQRGKLTWSPPPFRPSAEVREINIPMPDYGSFYDKDYLGILLYESRRQDVDSLNSASTKVKTHKENSGAKDEVKEIVGSPTPLPDYQPELVAEGREEPSTSDKPMMVDTKHDGVRKQSQSKIVEKEIMTEYHPGKLPSGTSNNSFPTDSFSYINTSRTVEKVEDSYYEVETYQDDSDIPDEMMFEEIKDSINRHTIGPELIPQVRHQQESPDTILHHSPDSASEQMEVSRPAHSPGPVITRPTYTPTHIQTVPPTVKNWYNADYDDFPQEDWSNDPNFGPIFPRDDFDDDDEEEEEEEDGEEEEYSHPSKLQPKLKLSEESDEDNQNREVTSPSFSDIVITSTRPSSSWLHPIPLKEKIKVEQPLTTNKPLVRRLPLVSSRTSLTVARTEPQTSPLPDTTTSATIETTTPNTQIKISSRYSTTTQPSTQLLPQGGPSTSADPWFTHNGTRMSVRTRAPERRFVSSRFNPLNRASPPEKQPSGDVVLGSQEVQERRKFRDRLPPGAFSRKRITPRLKLSRVRQLSSQKRRLSSVLSREEPSEESGTQSSTESLKATERSQPVPELPQASSKPRRVTSFMYKSMIHQPPGRERPNLKESDTYKPHVHFHTRPSTRDEPASSGEAPVSVSNAPVSSRGPPVSVSNAPVSSRGPPVSVSNAPVSSRGPPVSVSNAPVSSRGPPVSVSNAPVSSRGPPVSVSNAPVSSRGPPVSVNNAPVSSRGPPLSVSNAPVSSRGPPASTNKTPVSPSEPSVSATPSSSSNSDLVYQSAWEPLRE